MDNSNNQNLTRYIHTVLAKLSASGGGGGDEPSSAKIEFVDTLPTASEDTVGIFYVIPNPDGNTGTIHITQNDGSTYSWVTVRDPETANVQYTQQTLTEAQKQQARNNIDAASLADIENMDYVTATVLPTASAETMGHVYLIGPDSNNNYDRYYTQQNDSTYTWVSLGSTQLDLSTYATKDEVTQLEHEVTDMREYGTLPKYPSSNSWSGVSQSLAKYIAVKAGDTIYVKKNNSTNAYVAFVSSIDTSVPPSFANGTSAPKTQVVEETFPVVSDCYFIWVVQYNDNNVFEPSVLTLNGTNILQSTYSVNRISTLEGEVTNLEEGLDTLGGRTTTLEGKTSRLEGLMNTMVGTYTPSGETIVPWGEVESNKTWGQTDGFASLKANNHYFAKPTLYQVQTGAIVKLKATTAELPPLNTGAFSAYDNDGKPYLNGTTYYVNFTEGTAVDNGDGTTTFTFQLANNVSQLGFFYYNTPYEITIPYSENYEYSQELDEHIEEVAGNTNVDTFDPASYYLKGNSNIIYSPSKKLGIISAGQSNIDGRNSYSDLPDGFVNPNSKVKFCNNVNGTFSDFQITDGGHNNDWSFDAIVYDALTNPSYGNLSEIFVMKKSMGGTSIDKDGATNYHWTADYEYLASPSNSLLLTFEDIIRKAEELQGENFQIRAFLWHQGEGDADTKAVAERYYDNLRNMLAYVRGIVGNPRLDFFCGNISENNHANPYIGIINDAYTQLASEDPYFHCVDMRNAVLEDSWHFNYQWSIYFGQKVYDLMIDAGIITGTKINPSEPS